MKNQLMYKIWFHYFGGSTKKRLKTWTWHFSVILLTCHMVPGIYCSVGVHIHLRSQAYTCHVAGPPSGGGGPPHCIGRQNDRDSMKWGPTRSETSHRSLDQPNPTPLMMGLVNEPRSSHCCSNTWYITLLSHPAVNYFGLQLLGCPLAVKGDERAPGAHVSVGGLEGRYRRQWQWRQLGCRPFWVGTQTMVHASMVKPD